jgi:hypothetical protein
MTFGNASHLNSHSLFIPPETAKWRGAGKPTCPLVRHIAQKMFIHGFWLLILDKGTSRQFVALANAWLYCNYLLIING